jgi:hypothetical protein
MVFGFLATLLAQYPLMAGSCPELFPYLATPPRYSWDITTRSLHLGLVLVLLACWQHYPRASLARTALYIVWTLLPLLEVLGWLPGSTALWEWAVETYHTVALGGSPTAATSKALVLAVVGTLATGVLTTILQAEPSASPHVDLTAFVAVSALFGFALALDWSSFASLLQQCTAKVLSITASLSLLTKLTVLIALGPYCTHRSLIQSPSHSRYLSSTL